MAIKLASKQFSIQRFSVKGIPFENYFAICESGMTLIEVVLAVLIMAFAIIPISDMLSKSTYSSKTERSEVEAMKFACDTMDAILAVATFTDVITTTETAITRGQTSMKYTITVTSVPITNNLAVPYVTYHPMCSNGIEAVIVDGNIATDVSRTLLQLDQEYIKNATDFDLKDIELVVKWKPTGVADSEYERHPIVLRTRKARL